MLWDRLKSLFKLPSELAELSREELVQVSREVNERLMRDWRFWATEPIILLPIIGAYVILRCIAIVFVPACTFPAYYNTLVDVLIGIGGGLGRMLQLRAEAPLRKQYLRAVLAERAALPDAGPYAGGATA